MATNRDIIFTLKMRNEASATMRAFASDMKSQGKSVAGVAKDIQKLRDSFKGTGTVIDNAAKSLNNLQNSANSRPITSMVTALKNLNKEARLLGTNSGGLTSVANALKLASTAAAKFNENTGKKGQMDVKNYGQASTALQKLASDIKLVVASSGGLDKVSREIHEMSQAVALIQSRVSTLRQFAAGLQSVGKAAGAIDKVTKGLKTFASQGSAIQVVTTHIRNLDAALGQSANLTNFLKHLAEIKRELAAISVQAQRTQTILGRVGTRNGVGGRPRGPGNNGSGPGAGSGMGGVGDGQGIGGAIAATAGAYIGIQTVQQAVTNMAEYDQALANVRAATAVVGETSEQTAARIQALNTEVLKIGSNSTVGPKALLDVMTELGKAGLDSGNSLKVAADAMNLSQATGYDAADSAKALVVAMASFGLTTAESAKIADIFTNTVNATTADMADLAVGMKYAAPLANALGISINETSAVLGTLAQNGLDASTAGTSFAQMLEQIINPSEKAVKVLKSVGLTMADLDPRKKSLQEIFRLLRDKNLDEGVMAAVFGTQGFRPAQILSNTVDKNKGFTEINQGTENAGGEAMRTAADRTNSLMGDFQRLRSAIEGALNYEGQSNGILSTLREITQNVTGVIGVMSGLGTATGAQKAKFEEWAASVKMVGQALAALIAFKGFSMILNSVISVGNAFMWLGGHASKAYSIINGVMKLTGLRALASTIGASVTQYGLLGGAARLAGGSMTAMGAAAVTAIRAIGVAVAANPLGLLLTAIGLCVAALVYFKDETFAWGDQTVRVGDVVIALWERVKAGFETVGTALSSGLQTIVGWFSTVWESSKTALGGILADTGGFIKMLINGWVGYLVSVKDIFVTLGKAVMVLVKGMYDNATEMVGNITDALWALASGDFSGASEAMGRKLSTDIVKNLGDVVSEAGTQIKANFDKDYVGSFADATIKMVQDIKEGTLNSMDSIMQRAAQIGEQNRRMILEARKDADMSPFVTPTAPKPVVPTNSLVPSTNDSVGGIGTTTPGGDSEAKSLEKALNAQRKKTQEIRDQIKLIGLSGAAMEQEKAALDVINDLRSAGVTDEKAITDAVKDRVNAMRALTQAQRDYNANPLNGAKSAFQSYYDDAINYAKGTETAWTNALSGVEDAFVSFAETGKFSMKSVMKSFFQDMLRASYRSLTAQIFEKMGLVNKDGSAPGATVASIFSGLGAKAKEAATTSTTTTTAVPAAKAAAQVFTAPLTPVERKPLAALKTDIIQEVLDAKSTVSAAQALSMPNGNAMSMVGNYKSGVDQRLTSILQEAAARSGYKVEAFSGVRNGPNASRTSQHFSGNATDVRLIDPTTGRALENYQNGTDFRAYEQFAQQARMAQQQMYPELNDKFTWGGYFGGPKGKYGANDAMHFDLGGNNRQSGGSWENGLNQTQRGYFPDAQSIGMNSSAVNQQLAGIGQAAQTATTNLTNLGQGTQTAKQAVTDLGTATQNAKTAVDTTASAPVQTGQLDAHVQAYSASMKGTFDQSVAGVQSATQSYTQGLQTAAQGAANAGTQVQATAQATAATTDGVAPTLGGAFSKLLSGVGGIASQFLGGFGSVLQNLISVLGSMGEGAGGGAGGGGGLFSGIGKFFSSLFGGGSAAVNHTGGIVGAAGTAQRAVNMGVFRGAQRYHSGLGLKLDEFPTILQKGEYVVPRDQIAAMKRRHRRNGSGKENPFATLSGHDNSPLSPANRADRVMSPGQDARGVGGNRTSMTVINNIQAQDANSFRKSESQIGFETARSLNTQLRRTGNQHNN